MSICIKSNVNGQYLLDILQSYINKGTIIISRLREEWGLMSVFENNDTDLIWTYFIMNILDLYEIDTSKHRIVVVTFTIRYHKVQIIITDI